MVKPTYKIINFNRQQSMETGAIISFRKYRLLAELRETKVK